MVKRTTSIDSLDITSTAVSTTASTFGVKTDVSLPIRTGGPAIQDATLRLYPCPDRNGLLIKVTPPREPSQQVDVEAPLSRHVPCDIVLVIDVSGSMGGSAPVPGGGTAENYGLSILDLTKHAARTILQTMDERDRLGIVTFSTAAEVLQPLVPMDARQKIAADASIGAMQPTSSTNLWHGIRVGLDLITEAASHGSSRVPALMVLTDGQPNHMCPSQGYVPKLRSMMSIPAPIHTFGFGYHLDSGLLKSISELTSGNYAFIPDAGMIGTVFVHAVANLQSTFATRATMTVTFPSDTCLEETTGISLIRTEPILTDGNSGAKELSIPLGDIPYGQSRDIWLAVKTSTASSVVSASISFTPVSWGPPQHQTLRAQESLHAPPQLPDNEFAYHQSRAMVCEFVGSIFPLNGIGTHVSINESGRAAKSKELKDNLLSTLPARKFSDALNKSIVDDLNGQEPHGQVRIALEDTNHFCKWGKHYLPSLHSALSRQICNSFKDPGPLQFGTESPLFIECRDALDRAFDNLPPPKPSVHQRYKGTVSMSTYNSSSNVCFSGNTKVALSSGATKEIRSLRRGDTVETPIGSRSVAAAVRTRAKRIAMYRIGSVLVTPWHPVSTDAKSWFFPGRIRSRSCVYYTGYIYSVLLQPDENPAAHAIRIGNVWGVSLGHGIQPSSNTTSTRSADVRTHPFFGDYMSVVQELARLPSDRNGVANCAGVTRCPKSGLTNGFLRSQPAYSRFDRVAAQTKLESAMTGDAIDKDVGAVLGSIYGC